MLLIARARAYINKGRWVADCPQPYCNSALALDLGQTQFACRDPLCRVLSEVEWPANADELFSALRERPNPDDRDWAPAGHRQAFATGFPEGQTAAELRDETRYLEGRSSGLDRA